MSERGPYEVLGVPVGASVDEIRRAYLVLARRHHPDFHIGESPAAVVEAGRTMQAVNEAWAALSDPIVRRRYEAEIGQRFRPFHPDHVEADPRDAPDVPYRPGRRSSALERGALIGAVGLFGFALVAAVLGFLTSSGMLAVAVISLVLSFVAVLVMALLALGRAAKDEG
jgi:curved DNA-binding protein CbpA